MVLWWVNLSSHAQIRIYPFVENGKIGYKDTSNQIRIEPQFDYIEEFTNDRPWTIVGIGNYTVLNHNLDHKKLNFTGRFGLIDQYGNFIFKPLFNNILELDDEYAIVGNGNGFIHFENFPEEKNYVFEGDLGVVNTKGDTLIPIQYQSIQTMTSVGQTYWFAKKQELNALYSKDRIFILDNNVETITNFSDGLARIKTQAGFGFIDTTGQVAIDPAYNRAGLFNQGRAWVKREDQYFYINTNGERLETTYLKFDELSPFSDGVARVRIFDEYGFIEPDSTFLITPKFSEAGSFFNGITYVSTIDSFGYVHKDGRMDWVLRYENNPVLVQEIRENLPETLRFFQGMPCNCVDSSIFRISFDTLNLSHFITVQLEAMRWAPYFYYKYPQMLARVCAGEGTLSGRFKFNFGFLDPGSQPWEWFKQEVLFSILKDKRLRSFTWDWIKPYYKKVFHTMPEKHQEIYIRMIEYLSDYFGDYSKVNVEQFLKNYPDQFAYQHWDGSRSPFRKVSAFLERLIFIHHVMALEDVQYGIRMIQDDMNDW